MSRRTISNSASPQPSRRSSSGSNAADDGAGADKGMISKQGSWLARHLLGQAAQACRDKKIRKFYSEVSRRRGRPKAKVAAARKLLINCYVMLRDNIRYEEFTRRGGVGLCEVSVEVSDGEPAQSLKA